MTAFICTIPVLAGLWAACAMPEPIATGYVEGEFVLMAPVAIAQVGDVSVRRGQGRGLTSAWWFPNRAHVVYMQVDEIAKCRKAGGGRLVG